mmetsp:Transcript_28946/g.67013  ORF Transcript_28946/g.67013 Transcript_28946/m.67013 type:complete len:310 (+) Transcript_28946:56-985(+)
MGTWFSSPVPPAGYGVHLLNGAKGGAPLAFRVAQLPPDVLAFLQESEPASASEDCLESLHFERTVDYPSVPKHIYFEGCFHSLGLTTEPVRSMHPRHGGDVDKPAAHPRIMAFIEAFRQANASWLSEIGKKLPSTIAGGIFQKLFEDGFNLADVAVQIHFGDTIEGEDLGWHRDAVNSVLHMAVSLRGRRALHSYQASSPTGGLEHVVNWQEPGQVYISSPWAFMHAVEYPSASWDDRVVAMQCRFLMKTDDLRNSNFDNEKLGFIEAFTHCLSKADVRMPTLEAIQEIMARFPNSGIPTDGGASSTID